MHSCCRHILRPRCRRVPPSPHAPRARGRRAAPTCPGTHQHLAEPRHHQIPRLLPWCTKSRLNKFLRKPQRTQLKCKNPLTL
uniref:Uncharacterized protein n=1 Tax=Arundo donax TaxID=35708 RepID=A0A0A9FGI4_ARUDO